MSKELDACKEFLECARPYMTVVELAEGVLQSFEKWGEPGNHLLRKDDTTYYLYFDKVRRLSGVIEHFGPRQRLSGVIETPDWVYKGMISTLNRLPDGIGLKTWQNGDEIRGEYQNGFILGAASFRSTNGKVLRGEYQEKSDSWVGILTYGSQVIVGEFSGDPNQVCLQKEYYAKCKTP